MTSAAEKDKDAQEGRDEIAAKEAAAEASVKSEAEKAESETGVGEKKTEATESSDDPPPRPKKPVGRRSGGGKRPDNAPAKGFSWSTALILAAVLGVVVLFILSGRDKNDAAGGGTAPSRFATGQTADVEITLVAGDRTDLACASNEDVAGKHCAFETTTKPSAKGAADDKSLLRPYMTVGHEPMMAAGVWSDPALAGQLPTARFSIKCKYKVEGKVKKPSVRWQSAGPFIDETTEWPAGSVSNCTLVRP